jgi:alkylhydroperoxidase/carboxymuconolactone decarboxylase family protein YurZ
VFSSTVDYRLILRMLAVRDKSFFTAVEGDEAANLAASGLTVKEAALVRVAALVALDSAPASYAHAVDVAEAAGVTPDEVVGALVAVIPATGGDRVVSAAPKLGLALGYDVDAELEQYTS